MTNGICECLNNEEKILLLEHIESNKKKISKDIKNEMSLKRVHIMRHDIEKLGKAIDRVMRIPLC
jgi:16S rRNA G527 N7-methylase RsmG